MATTNRIHTESRQSGFTLIELLAVMLLILTVLGMGVPAMFAAERKSYVNEAMNKLIGVHRSAFAIQRELASRGESLIVIVEIINPTASPVAQISLSGSSAAYSSDLERTQFLEAWLGLPISGSFSNYPRISINSDEFISQVIISNVQTFVPATNANSWSYAPLTGFINSGSFVDVSKPIQLAFKALPSGSNWKINRTLNLYYQGYSDIP